MEEQFPIIKVMDDQGNVVDQASMENINEDLVKQVYRHMLRIRIFDRKAISLQRQGRIGTYPPFEGQEASQVGSVMALGEHDWVFPTYRDHGATLTFGADMVRTFCIGMAVRKGVSRQKEKNIFQQRYQSQRKSRTQLAQPGQKSVKEPIILRSASSVMGRHQKVISMKD